MSRKKAVHGFTAVDSQDNPEYWVRVLDKLHREPFYMAYKKRLLELLGPERDGTYLEIGTGAGDDALAVAGTEQTTVFAIDLSRTMITEARRRGLVTSLVADAACLPFADNTFDGCWSDRLFQHLADPYNALRETIRVTKPRGRLVVVDPDYSTQVMDFPDQELASKVFRFRAECGLRNGTIAHQMPGILTALGLLNIKAEAMTLVTRDPTACDNIMGLRTWGRSAQRIGRLTKDEVARWENLYDRTITEGHFLYAVTFFLSAGVKPG